MPIEFGDSNYMTGLEQTATFNGFIPPENDYDFTEHASALWDVGVTEFNYNGIGEGFSDNGFSSDDRDNTLSHLRELNAGEKELRGPDGKILSMQTEGGKQNSFAEFLQDDEQVKQYEEYIALNEGTNLKTVTEIIDILRKKDDAQDQAVIDTRSGNATWDTLLSVGVTIPAAFSDPVSALSLALTPAAKGKLATRLIKNFAYGAAAEIPTQLSVKDFKNVLGKDYNATLNILAGGAANSVLSEVFGVLSKAWAKKFDDGKIKNTPENVEAREAIRFESEARPVDKFEAQRAQVLFEADGTVTGAKLHLNPENQIDLDGISKSMQGTLTTTLSKQVASTLKATIGDRLTTKVLKSMKAAGKSVDDITAEHIVVMRSQKEDVSFERADEFINRNNELKANAPRKEVEVEPVDASKIDLNDKAFDALIVNNADGTSITYREAVEAFDNDIKDLEASIRCLI